jgi:hypothetical protein
MKKLLLILLISTATCSYGQIVNDLDTKRGFKEFKLGDSYTKWQSQVNFQRDKGEAKIYKFTGDNGTMFNSFPINHIELTFYKSLLVDITITLEKWKAPISQGQVPEDQTIIDFCNKKIQELSNRFEVLYGDPTKTVSPKMTSENNNLIWSAQRLWNAKKTSLVLALIFLELPSNSGALVVNIADKDYSVKSYTEGF